MNEIIDESVLKRFWAKVKKLTECWEWTASTADGYGIIRVGKHLRLAHRLSWEVEHGSIPIGLLVLHRCDNPKCVNPAHLFLGTEKDNAQDSAQKGRHRRQIELITHCKRRHEFTADNTSTYTRDGRSYRHCKACDRDRYLKRKTQAILTSNEEQPTQVTPKTKGCVFCENLSSTYPCPYHGNFVPSEEKEASTETTHVRQKPLSLLLDDIEQRVNVATPGPWEFQTGCSWRRFGAKGDGDVCCPTNHRIDHHVDLIISRFDGEFIAAARSDIPALVKALRRALIFVERYAPGHHHGKEAQEALAKIADILSERDSADSVSRESSSTASGGLGEARSFGSEHGREREQG